MLGTHSSPETKTGVLQLSKNSTPNDDWNDAQSDAGSFAQSNECKPLTEAQIRKFQDNKRHAQLIIVEALLFLKTFQYSKENDGFIQSDKKADLSSVLNYVKMETDELEQELHMVLRNVWSPKPTRPCHINTTSNTIGACCEKLWYLLKDIRYTEPRFSATSDLESNWPLTTVNPYVDIISQKTLFRTTKETATTLIVIYHNPSIYYSSHIKKMILCRRPDRPTTRMKQIKGAPRNQFGLSWKLYLHSVSQRR
eukprot:Selendium_serpulae@DN5007_c0_g1_i9.p2